MAASSSCGQSMHSSPALNAFCTSCTLCSLFSLYICLLQQQPTWLLNWLQLLQWHFLTPPKLQKKTPEAVLLIQGCLPSSATTAPKAVLQRKAREASKMGALTHQPAGASTGQSRPSCPPSSYSPSLQMSIQPVFGGGDTESRYL
eukprot:scaffold36873_cov14-Tisochrysis_lutea.AAC.2